MYTHQVYKQGKNRLFIGICIYVEYICVYLEYICVCMYFTINFTINIFYYGLYVTLSCVVRF